MSIFKKDASKPAADPTGDTSAAAASDPDRTAQIVATVVGQVLRAPAVDQELIDQERAKYKRPKDSTRAFKVHVRGGLETKRRAGIQFTTEPQIVNAEDLTETQAIELLNTPHLYVEELTTASKDSVKPAAPGAAAAGPSPDQLREPGDAPVPTPTNSPGRRGDASVLGGMSAVEGPPPGRETTAPAAPRRAPVSPDPTKG